MHVIAYVSIGRRKGARKRRATSKYRVCRRIQVPLTPTSSIVNWGFLEDGQRTLTVYAVFRGVSTFLGPENEWPRILCIYLHIPCDICILLHPSPESQTFRSKAPRGAPVLREPAPGDCALGPPIQPPAHPAALPPEKSRGICRALPTQGVCLLTARRRQERECLFQQLRILLRGKAGVPLLGIVGL